MLRFGRALIEFGRGLVGWLGLFNLLSALANLPNLGWLAQRRRDGLLGAALAVWGWRGGRWRWLSVWLAVPIQLALASLRSLWHNPLRQFMAGSTSCEPIQIMLDSGEHVPGLWYATSHTSTAILYLHGAGNDKTRYATRAIAQLQQAGFSVLAIDLAGQGENPRTLDVPDSNTDVAAAVAWLRQHAEHVVVVAVSLGGCIGARAIADGVAVDGLVIIGSPVALDLKSNHYIRSELRALLRPQFWQYPDRMTLYQLWQQWQAPPMRIAMGFNQLFPTLNLADSLSRIRAPILLVYGQRDRIAPYQAVLSNLATIPDVTLQLMPDHSHLTLPMETFPLTAVTTWIHERIESSEGAIHV
ncbi:alpha/beta fold hydrolase [Herpetosiphon sp.]|uniref:Alpha/beta hydrolase fold n=1 Tax=Herpetosiphon aurantiacus (strain ATCC 23779 / DSM 785 / 114-95) TaxID=316274 RepID=A9B620_HERA2|nr:alpha/beta fold hydrolase [Herpetosiphon sp.]ABX05813.1 alpha/beta hydrolase fold [Herpetosiphon aurantiacus DSM 785]